MKTSAQVVKFTGEGVELRDSPEITTPEINTRTNPSLSPRPQIFSKYFLTRRHHCPLTFFVPFLIYLFLSFLQTGRWMYTSKFLV